MFRVSYCSGIARGLLTLPRRSLFSCLLFLLILSSVPPHICLPVRSRHGADLIPPASLDRWPFLAQPREDQGKVEKEPALWSRSTEHGVIDLVASGHIKCTMAKIKPKALLAQSKRKKGPTQIGPTTIITYIILGTLVVSSVYAAYKYWLSEGPAGAESVAGN